uniref:CSON013218 protein n=1 Tax=Culicoides sonorensis TaxID=179676 RepID=A0A336LNG8_CULSO
MSGFNFGTPQTTTTQSTGFSFAAATPSTAASTGFGFGGTGITSTPVVQSTGGFSFGLSSAAPNTTTTTAPAATNPPGFSFGAPAASQAPTLTLGAPPQTQASTTGFNFGQPASNTTTSTAPTLSLGTPGAATSTTTSTAQPGFAFGGLGSTVTSSTAATGFGFGSQSTAIASTTATTQAPTGLGIQPTTGLNFGGQTLGTTSFGTTPASTAASTFPTLTGFGSTPAAQQQATQPSTINTTTVTVSKPVGLGGIDINASLQKPVEGKNDTGKVKENQVPVEIMNTVETLKMHIKQQKSLSSDIARTTTRKMLNVQSDIQDMVWNVQDLANKVQANKAAVKSLRKDTAEVIQHTDMAQRTHETPVGLQFENTAPLQYFIELTQKYENDLMTLKNQVELTEKHMISLTNPQSFTPEDLKKGLQQLHETFIALAGRLYASHQKVQAQKEQYLNLRKYLLNDKTDVFGADAETGVNKNSFSSVVTAGPNPFSTLGNLSYGINLSGTQYPSTSSVAGQQQQQTTQFDFNQSSTGIGTGSGFFNLQNPPFLGQKRQK